MDVPDIQYARGQDLFSPLEEIPPLKKLGIVGQDYLVKVAKHKEVYFPLTWEKY